MHISKCELLESVFFGNYEWVVGTLRSARMDE